MKIIIDTSLNMSLSAVSRKGFDAMTKAAQKRYLTEHPNSKFSPTWKSRKEVAPKGSTGKTVRVKGPTSAEKYKERLAKMSGPEKIVNDLKIKLSHLKNMEHKIKGSILNIDSPNSRTYTTVDKKRSANLENLKASLERSVKERLDVSKQLAAAKTKAAS